VQFRRDFVRIVVPADPAIPRVRVLPSERWNRILWIKERASGKAIPRKHLHGEEDSSFYLQSEAYRGKTLDLEIFYFATKANPDIRNQMSDMDRRIFKREGGGGNPSVSPRSVP